MWTQLALVVCLSALATGQVPLPCHSPPQWDARANIFDPTEGHEFYVEADYHYDKTGLRKARFEKVNDVQNSTYRYVDVIDLYAENKRYSIDVRNRECIVSELNREFFPHDVPAGARFRGLFYLGSSAVEEGSVEMQAWDYPYTTHGFFWDGSFTTAACIPYHSDGFNHTTFGARFESFADVTPGLRDPNVFIPPPECFH